MSEDHLLKNFIREKRITTEMDKLRTPMAVTFKKNPFLLERRGWQDRGWRTFPSDGTARRGKIICGRPCDPVGRG